MSGHGIEIESGTGNEVRRNSIFSNSGRGIDLGNDSFTLNDRGDADTGANMLLNYPVVSRVTFAGANKTIEFILNSAAGAAGATFTIEFFSNTQADPSGFGEGRTFLRDRTGVTTNAQGIAIFTETFNTSDTLISASTTDSNSNTSEFSMVDTDGDAAADGWESNGIDYNENGTIDLTLSSNPNHKDVWVEPDAMTGFAPTQATLNNVITSFGNAPNNLVQNPDTANGITLHATLDETTIAVQDFLTDFAEFDTVKAGRFGTPGERGSANSSNILAAKRLVYRYMVFGRQQSDSSSGRGELPELDRQIDPYARNDFYVTLGHPAWTAYGVTADIQAGTFMHELGHTLGLHHGGNDDLMYKPNYHSVMNYTWQNRHNAIAGARPEFDAFRNSWTLDYSRAAFNNLNENGGLNEPAGIGGHAGHVVPIGVFDPGSSPQFRTFVNESGPVDWNGNGNTTDAGVTSDLNGDGTAGMLNGSQDWSQLRYYFVESSAFPAGSHGASPAEMTAEQFLAIVGDVTAPLATAADFPVTLAPHRVRLTFSEDVSQSLALSDLTVTNLTTASNVTPVNLSYDGPSKTATFTFAGTLIDGNYRATLPAGSIADAGGNTLAADFRFDFFFLNGDANRDRIVDVSDLGILATNWQGSGKNFSQGDFNYDGVVNVTDLGILATSWQKSLPTASTTTNRLSIPISQGTPCTKHRPNELPDVSVSILS